MITLQKKSTALFVVTTLAITLFVTQIHANRFGSWSVSKELFDYIIAHLPKGSTILEFGSGWTTGELAHAGYKMYSIEHSIGWVNRFESTYIHAPLKDNWYDPKYIKENLPKHYDLILVDGPPGSQRRVGFLKNLELFDTNTLIILDDVNRIHEYEMLQTLAKKLNRKIEIHTGAGKKFGVLLR